MAHPFACWIDSNTIAVRYPGARASNPFALFSRDTLASLARRLALSETDPNDRELFVEDAEVARVLALNAQARLPQPVQDRLRMIAKGGVRRPRGRTREYQGLLGELTRRLHEDQAREYYRRCHARLSRLRQAARFECWRNRRGLGEDCNTPSAAAAELVRRRYFRDLSWRTVSNRLFSRKSDR